MPVTALANAWRHRWLLGSLLHRELRNRYAGTSGGLVWVFLHPMLMLAIYAVVFQYVFRVKLPDADPTQPYVVWVAVTMWPWLAFSEALSRGTVAVQQHADLVKKVAFPQELLVYSAVLTSLLIHAVGYAAVLLLLRVWGYEIQFTGVALVGLWAWLVLGCAATGLALFLGALQVFLRDVEQLLGQFLTMLFFASPVLYPLALAPAGLRDALAFNPLVHVFEPLRSAALGKGFPPPAVLLVALIGAATLWILGLAWFRRLSPHVEDQL
jgi:lipopolysaccharide transport system permease protein